jgi:hypothetical protein
MNGNKRGFVSPEASNKGLPEKLRVPGFYTQRLPLPELK